MDKAEIAGKLNALHQLQNAPLDTKLKMTEQRIEEAVYEFGLDHVYIAWSGGKDSTVLGHIARKLYPNILHVFSNTTNEYPETLKFCQEQKGKFNLVMVKPDGWNFRRVVEEYGYPMFSKAMAASIRGYRRARSEEVRQHYRDYIGRKGAKYLLMLDAPVSEKCCDILKKAPMKKYAHEHGLECAITGVMAEEGQMREREWIESGCNAFKDTKSPRSWPMAFWTDADVWAYIKENGLEVSEVYTKCGYRRNGCMYCGFGLHLQNEPNRVQRLEITHPKAHQYLCQQFASYFDACGVPYRLQQMQLFETVAAQRTAN